MESLPSAGFFVRKIYGDQMVVRQIRLMLQFTPTIKLKPD